jgi:hypothetical protein
VVALLGLLELPEIGVEVVLCSPGGAIDARQHRVVGIAAPVGTGHLHQLEGGADLAHARHVRAAAQVQPLALPVDLERLTRRDGVDQLDLERLTLRLEIGARLLARPDLLGEGGVAGDDLAHLGLDRREILRREGLLAVEVVVEAVLDDRADGHLRAGKESLHRLGQNVGAVVPDELERTRVLARDELDLRIARDRVGKVGQGAVEHHGDRALGQRLRDAFGDFAPGDAVGKLARGAIGEGQRNHQQSPAHSCKRRQVSACSQGFPDWFPSGGEAASPSGSTASQTKAGGALTPRQRP